MTDQDDRPSAFPAVFTDWRLYSRGNVVRITVEVPIEHSDHAYRVLGGMPNPATAVWVAIARLDPSQSQHLHHHSQGGKAQSATQHPQLPKPMTAPQQAANRCGDVRFQKWLHRISKISDPTEEAATAYIRQIAGGSRSNLGKADYVHETERWTVIEAAFSKFLEKQKLGDRY